MEHIGVLMMESRSYDTYFGWLEGGQGFLELELGLEVVLGNAGPVLTVAPAAGAAAGELLRR